MNRTKYFTPWIYDRDIAKSCGPGMIGGSVAALHCPKPTVALTQLHRSLRKRNYTLTFLVYFSFKTMTQSLRRTLFKITVHDIHLTLIKTRSCKILVLLKQCVASETSTNLKDISTSWYFKLVEEKEYSQNYNLIFKTCDVDLKG